MKAFGSNATAFVNAVDSLSKSGVPFMPSILVMNGAGANGGAIDGLAAALMKYVSGTAKPN